MKTKKIFGWAIHALLATVSISAQAQQYLTCPVPWHLLRLSQADLDAVVLGIRVRDWTLQDLERMRVKSEECVRSGPGVDSIRYAQHSNGMRTDYPRARQDIEQLAERVRQEQTIAQVKAAVTQSDLAQVVTLDRQGRPNSITVLYGTGERRTKTCYDIRDGIGLATPQSYRQAAQFARFCQQVGQGSEASAAKLEQQAAAIPELYKATAAFADRVRKASGTVPLAARQIQELQVQQKALEEQFKALDLRATDNALASGSQALAELSKRLEADQCGELAVKAGFPVSWKAYYILLEINSPELFCRVVQIARENGAQVRYLSGGWLSKEGFEVKSPKRTVRVFTEAERAPGGDPTEKLLIPVSAKIDGRSVDVNRGNLRLVAMEVIAAITNR